MYSYIKGIITEINNSYIVMENNNIGYILYVSNPYDFKKNSEMTIFVYQQVKEDDLILFGFKTKEERDLFLKLIKVKGIGCKTAIAMLASGNVDSIINAIETSNITYLKQIPGIGNKAAQQIVLDLKGKFGMVNSISVMNNQELEEATEVLLALGYKQSSVEKVMAKLVSEKLDTNGYVKKALSMLVK